MRVLHISPSFAPAYRYGGPVQSLLGLTKALIQLQAEVRVLTTDCDGPQRLSVPNTWTTFESIPVRYVHTWSDRDFAPGLLRTPRAELAWADVVHVTGLFCSTSMWGIAAAKRVGKPVVLSPHGVLDAGSFARESSRKRAWLKVFRPWIRHVDAFQTSSRTETESLVQILGKVRVVEVPNGVNLLDYEPNGHTTTPRVIALGRIHPIKGYLELIRAVALIQAQGLTVELDIAGPREDEAYARSLEQEATQLGLKKFRLLGALHGRAKAEFLASARVLALPSLSENFGMVVLEALASGVPVVASQQTPWQELESEHCGGWVSRSPESLAAALRPYLEDSSRATREGMLGRSLVERRYGWSEIARQTIALYETVMQNAA